jgi:molybdopterin converting factor small subunit
VIHITISDFLRHHTNGCATVDVGGNTACAALEELCGKFPDLRQCLFRPDDPTQVRRFMHVYVNNQERRSAADLARAIADGDEIILIPDVA